MLGDVGDASARGTTRPRCSTSHSGAEAPGGDSHGVRPGQPALVDVRLVVDQVGGNALVPGDVDEALRVRGVRPSRSRAPGRPFARATSPRAGGWSSHNRCRPSGARRLPGTRSRRRATTALVSSTDSVVWVTYATRSGSTGARAATSSDALDERDRVRRLALRTDDLLVRGVADEEDRVPALREAASLLVHLGDQRTCRVDRAEAAGGCVQVDLGRHAMRGEHADRALGHVLLGLDEDGATLLEAPHDVDVVHDLLAHVDGRTVLLEQALDRVDSALHPRAVPARAGEQQSARRDPVVCHRAEG